MTRGPTTRVEPTSPPPVQDTDRDARFYLREFSGALGDLGTFLPLSIALAVTCGMDFGAILVFAGIMNVSSGLLFRQPIPVQPMKAIAAVAIAEGFTPGVITSAGVAVGVMVLALALSGGVNWCARVVPRPVVLGIQAGVGLKLALTGVQWLGGLPMLGVDSLTIAAIIGVVILLFARRGRPVLFFIILAGFALLWIGHPDAFTRCSLTSPRLAVTVPTAQEAWLGVTQGAIPQLPLTLLNSVIALSALSADYFPGRGVDPKRVAVSVGAMNVLTVPFGAMPMCHGAGGLAAQFRFGARTGASVIILGAVKIAMGLTLGGALLSILQRYPVSILAVMVIAAGFTLASSARGALHGRSLIVIGAMTLSIVLSDTLTGFLIGFAISGVFALSSAKKDSAP
ncbi:MAG: putative sulfate/molybdate transporter [Phycisphaerales bacterium]